MADRDEREGLHHRPFAKLPKLPRAERAKPPPAPRPPPAPEPDDEELFAQAMHDVQRLEDVPEAPPPGPGRLPPPDQEDREVKAQLERLVRGEASFEISDTYEFIEGAVDGLDRRTRQRLKRGELSVQAHLDLHGLRREEAHAALDRFVREQRLRGHRCVLVIHGRGHNSPAGVPVLREQMSRWLSRGATGKSVLAFCTARPKDGGGGALYVLLRG